MKCCRRAVIAIVVGGLFVECASASTVVLNLDASNIAGSSGSSVLTWTDSSPNGTNATANTTSPSSAPTLQTNALNGQSVVNFAGDKNTQTGQSFNVAPAATSQPFTIFTVGKIVGNDATNSTDYLYDGSGANRVALGINPANTNPNDLFSYAGGANTIDYLAPIAGTGFHIFEALYNGANSKVYLDGTQVAIGALGTTALPALRIGSRTNVGQFLNGQIASMQIYTDGATPLTDVERNQFGSSLQSKYGLTGTYAAPEPSSILLMVLGMAGLALLKRRSSRSR